MVLLLRMLGDAVGGCLSAKTDASSPPAGSAARHQDSRGDNHSLFSHPRRRALPQLLASSPSRPNAGPPPIRERHQIFLCSAGERATPVAPVLDVQMGRSADAAVRGTLLDRPTGDGWRCFAATRSEPVAHHAVLSLKSVAGHEVRADATRMVMEMGRGDGGSEHAADGDGPTNVGEYRFPNLAQERPVSRHSRCGRPVGTGRNTRANLLQGYMRAIATTITRIGIKEWLEEFGIADEDRGGAAAVRSFVENTLSTPYRGQVWPLESVFGAVARISYGDQHLYKENELMTCWVASRGDVQFTCRGSTFKEAVLDVSSPSADDDDCYHAQVFVDALASVGQLLGDVDGKKTRRLMARMPGAEAAVLDSGATDDPPADAANPIGRPRSARGRGRGASSRSGLNGVASNKKEEMEDAEVEVFATGGLPIAVVVSGEGRWRVPAPVKCARKTTSCCYCDTSRKKSCVHVLNTRHLRQSDAAESATDCRPAIPTVVKDISRLELSPFNCNKAVQVDTALMDAARNGKVYKVAAPDECPKCGTPRGEAMSDAANGTVLSCVCIGRMELDACNCVNDECGAWVCAEGRKEGLVIFTPGTAASVMLLRHFAS